MQWRVEAQGWRGRQGEQRLDVGTALQGKVMSESGIVTKQARKVRRTAQMLKQEAAAMKGGFEQEGSFL